MNRYFYLSGIFLFAILSGRLNAQSTISGYTKDDTGSAVELTNVILLQLPDSTETAVTLSDSLGWYQFAKVKQGEYIVAALQLGYVKSISQPIVISDSILVI